MPGTLTDAEPKARGQPFYHDRQFHEQELGRAHAQVFRGGWRDFVPAAFSPRGEAEDKQVSVTIYNKNLALVEHVRTSTSPRAGSGWSFRGFRRRSCRETVSFSAAELELLEQNFDFDLLTPAKLMEKAVGGKVRLVRTNPATGAETSETAEVLSTAGGTVLRIGNRIEILREDNLPTRVIFDKVPENLRARPTLSVLVNSAQACEQDVRADLPVARALLGRRLCRGVRRAQAARLRCRAGSRLSNQVRHRLRECARAAGRRRHQPQRLGRALVWQYRSCSIGATSARRAPRAARRQQLADYYLYPSISPRRSPTTRPSRSASWSLEASRRARVTRSPSRTSARAMSPSPAQVRVRFSNSKAAGLGEPLPAGVVRVYVRDSRGQPQFIGEDRIGHTSAGSEIALRIGDAFDVTVQPTLVQTNKVNKRTTDYQMSYLVRNALPQPVVVTLRQDGLWRFNEIREESLKGRRTDADSFAWDVSVPANGETTLMFTIRQSW